MKLIAALALLAVAIAPAGAAPRKPSPRAAVKARGTVAPVNWTRRIVLTADGGFLIGNPAAKAKLVEYGSLSCPFCQMFWGEAHAPLDERIATGDISFEFRPYAVHAADPILHALLYCGGPANFRRFSEAFYMGQPKLTTRFEMWAETNRQTNPNATPATRIQYAQDWGFTAFALKHGVTAARVTACLSNTAAFRTQQAREAAASAQGVSGTPTFFVNGQTIQAGHWSEVEQAIDGALGLRPE